MSGQVAIGIIGYVIAVNVLAYGAMALDKSYAELGKRRISEATLLRLALLGGSVGTVVAQQAIRHKTRKQPFRSRLVGIVLLQLLALVTLVAALIITGSPNALWQLLAS